MKLTDEEEALLNGFSDEALIQYLDLVYGETRPVWRRCSKKEYEEHCGPVKYKAYKDWDELDTRKLVASLYGMLDYKAVPVYKDAKPGIIEQIKLADRKPDYYKYYKKKGEKRVIMIGEGIKAYLRKRGLI